MAGQWWSWLLTIVGVTGLYLAGRRSWVGWAIGLSAQGLWVTYAVATRQWGFIGSAVAYGAVNVINLRRWRRDRQATSLAAHPEVAHPRADRVVVERGYVPHVRGSAGVPVRRPEKL